MSTATAEEKAAALMIKGLVTELTDEDQKKVKNLAETLQRMVKANGDYGIMALTLAYANLCLEEGS